jgi:pimeloyl-ACP methyl ester carboxylesterase
VAEVELFRLTIGGKELEIGRYQPVQDAPVIVLLHEALGSLSHWKDFPALLANTTGCSTLFYSRVGHGDSEGPAEIRSIAYIKDQAATVLQGLLEQLGIRNPILFGHSEGSAICLFFAATHPGIA